MSQQSFCDLETKDSKYEYRHQSNLFSREMDSSFSGNGSPASTTSNNSSPVPYYRADSLVVEKPSHFNHEASESIEFYSVMNRDNSRVEVLVIDQSQPSCNSAPQSPGSGYNSSKTTDDEGKESYLRYVWL